MANTHTSAASAKFASKQTKKFQLVDLLCAGKPVSLDKMSSALGWQRHTTSAAMTRLKQDGYKVVSEKVAGRARLYRIAAPMLMLPSENAKNKGKAAQTNEPTAKGQSK